MKRRQLLLQIGALSWSLPLLARPEDPSLVAVRVWPAQAYTRVTLESDKALQAKHFITAEAPERLVVDIEGLDLSPRLKELVAKTRPEDPNIAGVRIGQYQPRGGAHRLRPEALDRAAGLHAEAGRRLPAPPGAGPLPQGLLRRGPLAGADRGARARGRGRRAHRTRPTRLGPGAGRTRQARTGSASRGGQARTPDRCRARPRPWRRGPGRHRSQRPQGEGCGAGGGPRAARAPRAGAAPARADDPRRRLLRAAARARAQGAQGRRRPLRLHPRRRLSAAAGPRRLGVRAQRRRRHQRRSALDGAARERRRRGGRPEHRGGARHHGAAHPARHEHHRADQGQPEARQRRAGPARQGRQAAQAARRAGRVCGAEGARRALDPGRDRLHSNPEEEAKLRDPAYQRQLVEAMARGLLRYLGRRPALRRERPST